MKLKKILISTLAITLILFLFGGLSQQFPWGVPTTQVVFSSEGKAEIFASNSKIHKFKANELTTEKFDDQFKGKISTLTTDKTFNWIVSTDVKNWQPINYFIREIIIQFFVGLFR